VVVRVDQSNGRTRLVVADEGAGVPREQRERIFSRFFRGNSDAVVRTRGVGIGLSVVKEFADQMGVTIDVSSSASGGAQFELWFPALGRPDAAPVTEEENRAPLS
jgi:signal transduction histidine kinase